MTSLDRIEQLAAVAPASAPADAAEVSASWKALDRRLQQALDTLWLRATHYAWVETQSVAVTGVGYWGGIRTVAMAGSNTVELAVHSAAVARALESRNHLLRIAFASVRTATAISMAVSNPIFALSAIRNAKALAAEIEIVLAKPPTR